MFVSVRPPAEWSGRQVPDKQQLPEAALAFNFRYFSYPFISNPGDPELFQGTFPQFIKSYFFSSICPILSLYPLRKHVERIGDVIMELW